MTKNSKREKLKSLVRFMDATLDKMNLETPLGEYLSYLESIKNSSRSIARIVNEPYGEPKKNNSTASKRAFSLKELLNHVKTSWETAGITIECDPQLPDFLIGHENHLTGLLDSLISKGCCFNHHEGVIMRCVLEKNDGRNAEIGFSLTFINVPHSKDSDFQFDRLERKILARLKCSHNIDTSIMNEIRLSLNVVFQLMQAQELERNGVTNSFDLNTNYSLKQL